MNFQLLNKYLKCVEAVMLNNNNEVSLLYGNFNLNNIDFNSAYKYLPKTPNTGEFVEYSSISRISLMQNEKSTAQVDILLTLNEPVYILRLSNSLSDYLIIKFYNINIKQSVLYSYENLQLIESVLLLLIQIDYKAESIKNDPAIDFSKVSKNQLEKINKLNDELNINNQFIAKILTSFSTYLISEINTKNFEILLSDSTIEFIKNSKIDLTSLKRQLQDAFKVACKLSPDDKVIKIKRYFITEEIDSQPRIDESSSRSKSKINDTVSKNEINPTKDIKIHSKDNFHKTEALLDKYESVAIILKDKNLPILGKNISSFCSPPISPPALTDSINKHSSRIKICLKNNPDKWKLLRNFYKPIKNLSRT